MDILLQLTLSNFLQLLTSLIDKILIYEIHLFLTWFWTTFPFNMWGLLSIISINQIRVLFTNLIFGKSRNINWLIINIQLVIVNLFLMFIFFIFISKFMDIILLFKLFALPDVIYILSMELFDLVEFLFNNLINSKGAYKEANNQRGLALIIMCSLGIHLCLNIAFTTTLKEIFRQGSHGALYQTLISKIMYFKSRKRY